MTDIPGNITNPITPSLVADACFVDAMHLVVTHITTVGVKHLATTPPMSRWNGTAWVTIYSPTY